MRQNIIMGAALIVALTVIGLAVMWVMNRGPDGSPVRVQVALRGSVSELYDRLLVEQVATELGSLGFDAHAASGPVNGAGAEGYAEARAMADAIDAGFTVLLDLEITRAREGLEQGTSLFDAVLMATLVPTSAAPENDAALPRERVEFAFERSSEADIAVFARDTWVQALSSAAGGWIFADPRFQERVLRGTLSIEETRFAVPLREHRDAVASRNERVVRFEEYCAREREMLAEHTTSEPGVECMGDPCGQWTLIGSDARGRAIVQDVTRAPYFRIIDDGISWSEPPERVLALEEGQEPELIYRTGHFFGFGTASQDGRFVSLHPFGMRELAVIVAPLDGHGVATFAGAIAQNERSSVTRPHPEARGALVRLRDRNWYYLDGRARITLPNFSDASWLAREGREPAVIGLGPSGWMIVAVDGGLEGAPMGAGVERRVDLFASSATEVWAQVWNHGGCELARLDLESRRETRRALPACLEYPGRLADGRVLGIARMRGTTPSRQGNPEVVIVDHESLAITPVTQTPLMEEVVAIARREDGTERIVFNRRLERWPREFDLGIYRRVVCWTDVPPRE